MVYAVRSAAASDVTSASAFLRVNLEAKLTTSSTTRACCSAVNCGNIGKRDNLCSSFFGHRKISLTIVHRSIGLLQVQWNRIVNSGTDAGFLQVAHHPVPVFGADHIEVINGRDHDGSKGATTSSAAANRRLYSAARSRRWAFHFAR